MKSRLTALFLLIMFWKIKGQDVIEFENEVDDINEAEFYVADEDDETSCMMNKDEDPIFKRCGFNSQSYNVEDMNLFYPEVEAKILEFAVKSGRKLLVIYSLITKSAKQREKLINVLLSKNGKPWLKQLKNAGSLVWKNSAKIIDALITPFEEFNSKMLNKRFNYLTTSVKKLFKLIPDTLQSIFQKKQKIFNSYMLTEILLESNFEERQRLKDAYFLKFKTKLENEISNKLSHHSNRFHLMLLNETRELPNSKEKIDNISNEIKLVRLDLKENNLPFRVLLKIIHHKIQSKDSKSEFKFYFLADLIGRNSPEIITEAFRKIKFNYNYSLLEKIKKGCIKMSFIDLAIKFLHDPYGYYATHVKILLDQKDFGYYLSRLFFAYPKQKLFEVSKAFRQIYKVSLKDYIKSRLNELNPSKFDKITGRYEEYSSYLRAMLASIGDVEWCSGPCRVTQN